MQESLNMFIESCLRNRLIQASLLYSHMESMISSKQLKHQLRFQQNLSDKHVNLDQHVSRGTYCGIFLHFNSLASTSYLQHTLQHLDQMVSEKYAVRILAVLMRIYQHFISNTIFNILISIQSRIYAAELSDV